VKKLLERLKDKSIEKVWKTVLESALTKARSGDVRTSRKALRYLIKHVPWYGPLYQEALRLEEKAERPQAALKIVHLGLKETPRYGPLWFGAFRAYELDDIKRWNDAVAPLIKSPSLDMPTDVGLLIAADLSHDAGCYTCLLGAATAYTASRDAMFDEHQLGTSIRSVWERDEVTTRRHINGGRAEGGRRHRRLWRTHKAYIDAIPTISKELVWKVFFEEAAMHEREATHVLAKSHLYDVSERDNSADAWGGGYNRGRASARRRGDDEQEHARSAEVDRFGDGLGRAREAYVSSALACPLNLRWKVWLAGARMELAALDHRDNSISGIGGGDSSALMNPARKLLQRAFDEAPDKSRSHVYLECARLEELAACPPTSPDEARLILRRACEATRTGTEWKVFLESINAERRDCKWQEAAVRATDALKLHPGSSRLWALLVQLRLQHEAFTPDILELGTMKPINMRHPDDATARSEPAVTTAGRDLKLSFAAPFADLRKLDNVSTWDFSWAQQATLRLAFAHVPKSGEVWCEASRVHLNPLSRSFDLVIAKRCLDFAVQFTPQYGDSFIEALRLSLLALHYQPRALHIVGEQLPAIKAAVARKYEKLCLRPFRERGATDLDDDALSVEEASVELVSIAETIMTAELLLPSLSELRAVLEGRSLVGSDVGGNGAGIHNGRTAQTVQGPLGGMRQALSTGMIVDTVLSDLELRCTNADPNYGVSWFHCRGYAYETSRQVLRRAQVAMAHELKALGPVYLQALCRRLLVGELLWAVLEAHPDSDLLMQALRDPPLPPTPTDFQSPRGGTGDGGRRSDEATAFVADGAASDPNIADAEASLHDSLPGLPSLAVPLTSSKLTAEVQAVQESEGWGFAIDLALRRAPPVVPEAVFVPTVESPEQLQALGGWVQDHGGRPQPLLPEDFSTGLLSLNRFLRAFKTLPQEYRRKILFGSDVIIP